MRLNEDEVEQDPVIQIYNDTKNLLRGKVEVDYKDETSTTFGILLDALVELKFDNIKIFILRLYTEPPSDVIQNLSLVDQAQSFETNLPHILIQNSEESSTLFSFFKVVPEEELKKVILQDHNIESYKELLNFAYDVFKNNLKQPEKKKKDVGQNFLIG